MFEINQYAAVAEASRACPLDTEFCAGFGQLIPRFQWPPSRANPPFTDASLADRILPLMYRPAALRK